MASGARTRVVLDQDGGNLALDLFVVTQHLGRLVDTALAPEGLTGSAYAVYGQLAQGPRTPGELSAILGMQPSTLSGYLKAMQQSGHTVRTRSMVDGRSSTITLTEAGLAVAREGARAMGTVVAALTEALGGRDATAAAREVLADVDEAIRLVASGEPTRGSATR